MKKKYEFHPELKKYANIYIPVYKWSVSIAQAFQSFLYMREKTNEEFFVDEIKVRSFDNEFIRSLIFTPKNVNLNKRCVFFLHGGGYAFRGSPHHFSFAKTLALRLECRVVFIDYRLAPKYKVPYAQKDCFEVYKWIVKNAKYLDIDENEIILVGDSAGGNLSLVTSILAKREDIAVPKCQVLLYPAVSEGMKTDSYIKYTDTPMCNSKDCERYAKLYFEKDEQIDRIYLSPIESDIYKGYPATYIEVAEYDCLHDDGVMLYNKLKENNVLCEFHEVNGAMHGYNIAIKSRLVTNLIEKRIEFIENVFNKA